MDVDLEDKLLYGLTPMRLAYLVVALLCGYAVWSPSWAPTAVRAVLGLAVVGIGATAAWGRWRGRAVDAWIADLSIFVLNTRRVSFRIPWFPRRDNRPSRPPVKRPQHGPIEIVVAARAPRAGATTVAVELAECLAGNGYAGEMWSVRPALAGYEHKPTPSALLVSVAAVDGGRVCYLDRGSGPYVAGLIPEDEHVREAAALNQATVIAFPDAPASRAFRALAEGIAATA